MERLETSEGLLAVMNSPRLPLIQREHAHRWRCPMSFNSSRQVFYEADQSEVFGCIGDRCAAWCQVHVGDQGEVYGACGMVVAVGQAWAFGAFGGEMIAKALEAIGVKK